jgi:hypothetical protein
MKKLISLAVIFLSTCLLSSCSPETSKAWGEAAKNLTSIAADSYRESLNSSVDGDSAGTSPATCMWNPTTQGMAQCFHVTAGGQCAHYGGPC